MTEIEEDGVSTTFNYDEFDMLVSTNSASEHSIHTYDYRGRRVEHGFGNANKEYQTTYTYSDGTNVLETKLDMNNASEKTTLFYRGSDQGGGVGGINYSEFANGDDLNYKFYNLRGDVIMGLDSNRNKTSSTYYFEYGQNEQISGDISTDRHRANTKVEDETNLLNDGKRFRHLDLGIFLTPDPLEYVDGFNPYIYCNQNPWGRWDPIGLKLVLNEVKDKEGKVDKEATKKNRDTILNNLQKLTNDKLVYNDKTGEVSINKKEGKQGDKDLPNGTKLIAEIIKSKKNVSIEFDDNGENGVNNYSNENASNRKGSDVAILLNKISKVYVFEGTRSDSSLKKIDPSIILAHELIHAYRSINGIALPKNNANVTNYTYRGSLPDGSKKIFGIRSSNDELETIGLMYFPRYNKIWGFTFRSELGSSHRISENNIRQEQGFPNRIGHEGVITNE